MIKTLVFVILMVVIAIYLIVIMINGCTLAVHKIRRIDNSYTISRFGKNVVILTAACMVCLNVVGITRLMTGTPVIKDEHGRKNNESIAELRQITLNGREEWISIRGHRMDNPVLLFLAGGPGGSQMAAVRHDLTELEKHFIVVSWDQPGSGKSYNAIKTDSITVDTYIEDGYKLTKYLCNRFGKEKIYIVGESWGSALGIFLIDKAPELYHAFIGTGQMVSFLETEIMDYELALKLAYENQDTKKVEKLVNNGPPPYYGKEVSLKSAEYLNYLSAHMARNPAIHNGGFQTFRDVFSNEYGLLDKVNYFRGILNTFNAVYPQLYETDLRKDYADLKVPVYFFLGRHDINAPLTLAEEYFEILDAPHKEIVWFEKSGHNPWINESDKFVQELIRITL